MVNIGLENKNTKTIGRRGQTCPREYIKNIWQQQLGEQNIWRTKIMYNRQNMTDWIKLRLLDLDLDLDLNLDLDLDIHLDKNNSKLPWNMSVVRRENLHMTRE